MKNKKIKIGSIIIVSLIVSGFIYYNFFRKKEKDSKDENSEKEATSSSSGNFNAMQQSGTAQKKPLTMQTQNKIVVPVRKPIQKPIVSKQLIKKPLAKIKTVKKIFITKN